VSGVVVNLSAWRKCPVDPAVIVRTARGPMSREAFAAALTPLLPWRAGAGMVRAWEEGVGVPPEVLRTCLAIAAGADPVSQSAAGPIAGSGAWADAVVLPWRGLAAASGDDLTAWITAGGTSAEAIEHIEQASAVLEALHSTIPDRKALADVLQLHHNAQLLLRRGGQRLRQIRELAALEGNVLAHASVLLSNLGEDGAAETHARAALVYLDEAGASQATAWYALAKIARWQRDYAAAADLARQGLEQYPDHVPSVPMSVQLASYEANAAALDGDRARARKALARAGSIADRLPATGQDLSPWSFPAARQAIFRLSVLLRTGDATGALKTAAAAEQGWAAGAPRNPSTWAQVRIGAAIAHLAQGSLDGAAEQVGPVLALPPEMRITTVTGWLADLDQVLSRPQFADSRLAGGIRREVHQFRADALREAG
jgi:tetratricopeptide (TPR) repeat protein